MVEEIVALLRFEQLTFDFFLFSRCISGPYVIISDTYCQLRTPYWPNLVPTLLQGSDSISLRITLLGITFNQTNVRVNMKTRFT